MSPISPIRIRPRSAIADPDLARVATVDLPGDAASRRGLRASVSVGKAIAAFRRPIQEPVIILTLAPVPARRR